MMPKDGIKPIARNKKAFHDYEILDKWEAGIALRGTEVKSVRNGKVQMGDAYARIEDGQAYLVGLHISAYDKASQENHDPTRRRKLLLHGREIRRLAKKVRERGFTLIPLQLYFRRGYVKVELGLATGKRQYDKRQKIKEREHKRRMDQAMRRRR